MNDWARYIQYNKPVSNEQSVNRPQLRQNVPTPGIDFTLAQ